jgi:threonine dehydrogenase-like Zn-dependent dehydrogenase
LLEKKLVDVDSMIDAEFPIERGTEAFERAATRGVLKVMVTF